MNENEFFREMTFRICGSLDVEKGLQACCSYLSRHMPTDKVYLERHDHEFRGVRIVAVADAEEGRLTDILIPLPPEGWDAMMEYERLLLSGDLPPVVLINRCSEEPAAAHMLRAMGEPESSYMGLPLIVEGKMVGAFGVLAAGQDRFTEEHVRLFGTLKEPFFAAMSNALRHEEVIKLQRRLVDDNRYINRELLRRAGDHVIGGDFGLREVMDQVHKVAPTDSPVLLIGETGSGKDVLANAIHLQSPRSAAPFVPVNCGAIPDSLIDSELFGHEKGAFTGALATKRGRFERANGGTILLDEIGEMPLEAQVRLLRVLQHKEIERVGGTERIPVDIRIIAATHRDLSELVREGRFREDLYFRLNVFPIQVPPLRDHRSDIPALVRHFIERKAIELKCRDVPKLAPGAIDDLMNYGWPGNVRELENVIERAMIIAHSGEPLSFDELGPTSKRHKVRVDADGDEPTNLDAAVAWHIRKVLALTAGKIHGPGGAGELLGVNPNTLRSRMRKLGIPFQKRKGDGA